MTPGARRGTPHGGAAPRWLWWAAAACLAVHLVLQVWAQHGPAQSDLWVYAGGGKAVLEGRPLYGVPVRRQFLFTYPPFAGVVSVAIGWFPLVPAVQAVVGAAALAGNLGLVCWFIGRAVPVTRSWPGRQRAVAAFTALLLEPVHTTVMLGQVNLALAGLVALDLLTPSRAVGWRRWLPGGVLVGLAAGIKLTPLFFLAVLVVLGRRGDAVRAAASFLGTVAIGFLVLPGASRWYWTRGLLGSGITDAPGLPQNQSVRGVLLRAGLEGRAAEAVWLAVCVPLAIAALVILRRLWAAGEPVLGVALAGMTMCAVSPFSWAHHWVWFLILAAGLLAGRDRPVGWTAGAWPWGLTAATVAAVLIWFGGAAANPDVGLISLHLPGWLEAVTQSLYPILWLVWMVACAVLARGCREGRMSA